MTIHRYPCHIHARSESPAGCSSKLELPPKGTDHMVGVDGGQVGLLRCGFACMGGGGDGGVLGMWRENGVYITCRPCPWNGADMCRP